MNGKNAESSGNERIKLSEEEMDKLADKIAARLETMNMLKPKDEFAYKKMNDALFEYYSGKPKDSAISEALKRMTGDAYFEILEMYYGQGFTQERIAEKIGCDTSTITKNKKRLCLHLYKLINMRT